jgi:hypothetical protein
MLCRLIAQCHWGEIPSRCTIRAGIALDMLSLVGTRGLLLGGSEALQQVRHKAFGEPCDETPD